MPRKETALAVLLGCAAFAIVASRSLFVEGEATGGIEPGYHPTTEGVFEPALHAAKPVVTTPAKAASRPVRAKVVRAAPSRRTSKRTTKATSRVPAGYVYWKTVRAKVTAYDPSRRSCGRFADGKTSIGQNAWVMDGVASDPRVVPYGTYVVIPGAGGRTVDDTGSAMRRSWRRYRRVHLDLRMKYPYQAKRWGVKYLDIKLYRKAG
ncbi:MAG: hypothetical protein ACYTAN_11955 [Planctomycetota bacterium]|jgi:3D (Asp-Asp-Asp) domain-containing protein